MEHERLGAILADLQTLDRPENLSRSFLEVRDTGEGREVTIRANTAGLVYLAAQLLELAVSANPGKHVHVDEVGIADHCDRNLVLTYTSAPWD